MKRELGFSLIELMISVVLGLILLAGIIQMFSSSRSAFSSQQAISRVQETGRLAMEFITRDIRMAGFVGCASKRTGNVSYLNNSADFANDWLNAIQGYSVTDDAGAGVPVGAGLSPTPLKDTDLFVIRGAFGNGAATTVDKTSTTFFSTIVTNEVGQCAAGNRLNGLCSGDAVVASDCTAASVFRISSLTNNAGVMEVAHTAAAGNNVASWGGAAAVTPDHHYLAGTEIYKLNRVIYFIARGASGRPSLFQNVDGINTELLDGVEDMSVTYGTATIAGNDAPPDQYRSAAAVTAAGDWGRVLSLRVQLLMQSAEDNVIPQAQTYSFQGSSVTGTDRRLRQVFATTVGIRSRLP